MLRIKRDIEDSFLLFYFLNIKQVRENKKQFSFKKLSAQFFHFQSLETSLKEKNFAPIKVFLFHRIIKKFFSDEALIDEPLALAPVVTSEAVSATAVATATAAATRSLSLLRGDAEAPDPAPPVGEPVVEEFRSREEGGSAEVLRVLEHEKEVEVADHDPDELHDAAAGDDHVEAEQDPRQVHGLELRAEPKVDDLVLVELAPDVEDAEHHRVHQELDVHEEGDRHGAEPVEKEHEEVVG